MRYEKPSFVEIKMDAEIGSYQNDFDPIPVPNFADETPKTDETLTSE